jgi:hypothetical protein
MYSVEHFRKCSSYSSPFKKLLQFSEGVELGNQCTMRDPILDRSLMSVFFALSPICGLYNVCGESRPFLVTGWMFFLTNCIVQIYQNCCKFYSNIYTNFTLYFRNACKNCEKILLASSCVFCLSTYRSVRIDFFLDSVYREILLISVGTIQFWLKSNRTKDSLHTNSSGMDGWMDGWLDGWMDGRTDGRTDRQTDGETDRHTDRQTDSE